MLENVQSARERWGGVSDLIDRWLRERQDLIVKFCDVSGTTDFSDTDAIRARFVALCEVLVDYVSAGHFEVYEQLIREAKEFDDGGMELVAKVYPKLEEITEEALSFNDRLNGDAMPSDELEALMEPLSNLGEQLETRFELEDFLIEHLHNVHADKVASPSSA
ncbi:sigma D regulator [Marinobacter halodurans]|uniref:Sigma D regulator n=1 Tax=Marinobacter halodurans TaxID=2528979 RepID=A0ABY1ZRP5_9GAMM|nr:sigma D regulator [Marinobacter halodurans]TBW58191.1 sigma D regulator [Marinobacter halodurans]